ncbi:MAG: hypothetical protein M3Z03_16110, partial [Actinomycetota bacterium]|nr:hypothetical protein [Actinomycetota bacterium]
MGHRWRRWTIAVVGGICLTGSLLVAPSGGAQDDSPVAPVGDPNAHLRHLVELSPPPTYRRFGSPGLAAAADHAAGVLEAAGYDVIRHDRPSTVWDVDYRTGREPSLVRLADDRSFPAESAVELRVPTPPDGLTCTVRPYDQVGAGECGFVPYEVLSPEWNNFTADLGGAVRTIHDRGGVGAVLQGDLEHDALIALKVTSPIPAVVSLVTASDVVDQSVQMRALGAERPATLHNVVGLRPPSDPREGYVLL